MKRTFAIWWAFFWRYVLIFFILLFLLSFFVGINNGIYLEVITSVHTIVDVLTKSDEIVIRIIIAACHIVASFVAIALLVRKRKLI